MVIQVALVKLKRSHSKTQNPVNLGMGQLGMGGAIGTVREVREGVGEEHSQNTLYTCMKLSKNRIHEREKLFHHQVSELWRWARKR